MTEEEMRDIAGRVIALLKNGAFTDVELMDFTPGDPLPIMFVADDEWFVLELKLA